MSSYLIEGKDFVAQNVPADHGLTALCLRAGEGLTHMGQTVIYSSPRLQGKRIPSCLGSFPIFCHSDLRSGDDRQRGLGSTSSSPKQVYPPSFSAWDSFNPVSIIPSHLPEELTAQGSLVGKLSLMVSCNIPWPKNQRKLTDTAHCWTVFCPLQHNTQLPDRKAFPSTATRLAPPPTPGILGIRRLPGPRIQNLMVLLSVLKPSRNLITEL